MVPLPIALLALLYGVMAAVSAATLWKILTGASAQSVVWPMMWFVLSAGAMCGLPLLKPWARTLAVFGSAVMAAITLAVAGLLVLSGRPLGGLLATLGAAVHVIVIRYLQRPEVRDYFRCEVRGLR